ncbi:MAG: hypothetical protein H6779_04320 [Candidatus Nomurabacteria bacterium]|nr:MAG: hypothetical protein H6779_04320 [Candidatus Nomurabacteria bacterium]
MKILKNTINIALIVALVIPVAMFVTVPKAEAACSYQGFISSHGKCAKSFKSEHYYEHDDEDEDEGGDDGYRYRNFYGDDYYNSQISRLLALIAQLQALLDVRNGTSYGDNAEIDVTTQSAISINDDSATLRGIIDFNNSETARVWFEYGTSLNNLNRETSKINLDDTDPSTFSKTVTDLDDNTRYYFRAVGEDENGDEDRGVRLSFITDRSGASGNSDEPVATTEEAENVDEDSAELNGSVDMNDFDNGRVFFVYGEDEGMVEDVEDDYDKYVEVEESGDNLQKVLVDSDLDTDDDYARVVNSLNTDTEHYFAMCVEYENEDGDDVLTCGSVENFTTDDTSANYEYPTANTSDADLVTSTSAELNGSVDMNDFDNGRVFFVYGTNESEISDIADDYDTYTGIVEDENLFKVSVDADLDGVDSYTEKVEELEADTEYFTSICVQFENEDNDDTLVCGDVERFKTDAS